LIFKIPVYGHAKYKQHALIYDDTTVITTQKFSLCTIT